MIQRHLKAFPVLFMATVIMVMTVVGFSSGDLGQWQLYHRVTDSSQVPEGLTTFWGVWNKLQSDYGGKEALDEQKLEAGAVQGLLDAVGQNGASYLSPEEYDTSAPNMGGVWQAWTILIPRLEAAGVNVSEQKLEEGAIQGMLNALGNPYTAYMSPQEYDSELKGLESSYEGIGIYVATVNGQLTVVQAPIADTPAERAGLIAGDIIVEVNGESIAGLSVDEAAQRIRGPKGTSVELLIQSPGESAPRLLTVMRDQVNQKSVTWQSIGDGLAYMRIDEFMSGTADEVKQALKEILAQDSTGLIVDLRHNPGGLLDSVIAITSQFLKDGLVLYQMSGEGQRTDTPVRHGGMAPDIPMVVLVNGASASASEVMTAALQDHGRATIIGTQTFGKGSVNQLEKLGDGSGLYLTVALWYSPNGRLIEGEGLTPDIYVPLPRGSQTDLQLQAAAEYLLSDAMMPVK